MTNEATPEQAERARLYGMTPEELAEREERTRLRESRDAAVLLPAIREQLGLEPKIVRVVKTATEDPSYRLETTQGVVRLGSSVRWIVRPSEFEALVVAALGEAITAPRGHEWRELCAMIARAAEVEDLGEEATDAGLGRAWLRAALDAAPPVDLDEWDGIGRTIRRSDELHVVAGELRLWLRNTLGDRITYARLGEVLRAAGCEPSRVDVLRDGRRVQARTWLLPDELAEQCH